MGQVEGVIRVQGFSLWRASVSVLPCVCVCLRECARERARVYLLLDPVTE
jgi:hypothetical protein